MYFEDYGKKKANVNLGDRNIMNKDDFLKKMKEDEDKEKKKIIIAQNKLIIKEYFTSQKPLENSMSASQLINNLQSIIMYFSKNTLPIETKDQIVIKSIEKTIKDSILLFKHKTVLFQEKINLMKIIVDLLIKHLSLPQVKYLVSNDNKLSEEFIGLYISLIKIGTVDLHQNLKRKYIINDNNSSLILLLNIVLMILPQEIIQRIIDKIALNIGQLFLLRFIIGHFNLITNKTNQAIIFEFICRIAHKLTMKRRRYIGIDSNYDTHPIINDLLIFVICNTIHDFTVYNHYNHNESAFLYLYSSINKDSLLRQLSLKEKMTLFHYITNSTMNQDHDTIINDQYVIPLIEFMLHLSTLNLISFNRTVILKTVSDLIEFLFKSNHSFTIPTILNLIISSCKLIENFYKSNYEKTTYQSILDHIVNKIIMNHSSKITNEVLTYSVQLLQDKFPNAKTTNNPLIPQSNTNSTISSHKEYNTITSSSYSEHKDIIEVICFFVINQINYKSNYFFVEFKATNDIYQNLPFNYFYLNLLSKYLINLFTEQISLINFDEAEQLKDNIIIICLKSLYLLDKEINYTYNHEEFWNNLQLVSKLTNSNSSIGLKEKIKIIPFIFPLKARLQMALREINQWKAQGLLLENHNFLEENEARHEARREIIIPRKRLFATSLDYYYQNILPYRKRWNIVFVDEFNKREEGIDGGGLFREYIGKVTDEGFGKDIGLFIESATGFLIPYQDSIKKNDYHLLVFEFLGFITGKIITEDIKITANLSPIFFNNILEIENSFIDLKGYDSELYKNLVLLMQYQGNVENDFGLTFSVTELTENDQTKTVNLIANGENIPVTNDNKLLYIRKMTDYKLYYQFKDQCNAFRKGMEKGTDMELIKMFTGDELRQLINGFDKDAFDIEDLKANVSYANWDLTRKEDQETLSNLFTILSEFDEKEKEKFLFFVTSLKRPPIGGFARLRPQFSIFKSNVNIPTASTCGNMLKLPPLPIEKMRSLLRYVINADAGFYYA